MATILVLGAGLNGLAAALLLARDGHQVTVLERDASEPAGDNAAVWASWQRPGVSQFHQLHLMLARWGQTMAAELPEVITELEGRGGARLNLVHQFPTRLTGGVRPGDERFEAVTGRRPVVEAALAAVADRATGLTVRRGVTVIGVLDDTRGGPVPHVCGVRTGDGEVITADLVVDASGRRTSVPAMLATFGARPPLQEREDAGFVYYTRHFRSRDGSLPPAQALLLQHYHGYSALTLPGDAGTWGVGIVTSSRDRSLRGLRDVDAWMRALSLVPAARDWLVDEPITDVQVIAGIEDRYRRYVVDGVPVCTGLVPVGDAWACTNPSLGRGATIGLLHAVALRDVVRETSLADRHGFALAYDAATEARITPWYRMTRTFDRHRLAEIDANLEGRSYHTADPTWSMSTAINGAALRDPDVLRAHTSIAQLLQTPPEALAAPGVLEASIALGGSQPRYPADAPGHDEIVAAVEGGPAPTRHPEAQPVRLSVHDFGVGEPVLLLHGWPDCHTVWQRQIRALTEAGYRAIVPDLRGFGDSDKPDDVGGYGMLPVLSDLLGVLDRLGIERTHVVGHDWGGAIGAMLAALAADRVRSLTCLSVGHPAAFAEAGWQQREKSWYMLLFQFPGIAEQWLSQQDFANLRAWSQHPQIDEVVARLEEPGALSASLGLYRAILPPATLLAPAGDQPPIRVPALGLWGSSDFAVTEAAMTGTQRHAAAGWSYRRVDGAGHWLQLDAPEVVNQLIIDFLDRCVADRLDDVPVL